MSSRSNNFKSHKSSRSKKWKTPKWSSTWCVIPPKQAMLLVLLAILLSWASGIFITPRYWKPRRRNFQTGAYLWRFLGMLRSNINTSWSEMDLRFFLRNRFLNIGHQSKSYGRALVKVEIVSWARSTKRKSSSTKKWTAKKSLKNMWRRRTAVMASTNLNQCVSAQA